MVWETYPKTHTKGEVYRIHNKPLSVESTKTHSRSLWAAWVDYTEYTANPYGGMGEVCRIRSKPPWGGMGEVFVVAVVGLMP